MRHQHVPVMQTAGLGERADDPHRSASAAGRCTEATDERRGHSSVGSGPRRNLVRAGARGCDRTRLQHPHAAVRIERPLGVLWRTVVALDPDREIRKLTDLRVVEHRPRRLLR